MSKKTVYIIYILFALAIIPVYWLQLAYHNILIRDGLFLSVEFIAVIAGIFAVSKYGFKSARGLAILLFTLGLISDFTANLIFEYFYIVDKNNIPFPSIGDLLSLLFFIFFLVALVTEVKLAHVNWKKLPKHTLILPILLSIVLTIVVSYLEIYKAYDPTQNFFSNFVSMAYGVGYLILIIICIFLTVLQKEYQGGRLQRIWILMIIALLMNVIDGIFLAIYLTQYNNEVWFYKCFFDTVDMLGYLFLATFFTEYGYSVIDAYKLASTGISKNATPIVLNTKDSSSKTDHSSNEAHPSEANNPTDSKSEDKK